MGGIQVRRVTRLRTVNEWIDRRFDVDGIGAFRSVRLGLFVLLPLLLSLGIMELFGLDAHSKATLPLILGGGAASIVLILWVSYRAAVWAQKVAVQEAAAKSGAAEKE